MRRQVWQAELNAKMNALAMLETNVHTAILRSLGQKRVKPFRRTVIDRYGLRRDPGGAFEAAIAAALAKEEKTDGD